MAHDHGRHDPRYQAAREENEIAVSRTAVAEAPTKLWHDAFHDAPPGFILYPETSREA